MSSESQNDALDRSRPLRAELLREIEGEEATNVAISSGRRRPR